MLHTSKMVMIPQDAYSNLLSKQQEIGQPLQTQLSILDQEMKLILANPSLPADLKMLQYDQALRRYQHLKSEQQKPLQIQIKQDLSELMQPNQLQQPQQQYMQLPHPRYELPVSENEMVDNLPKNTRPMGRLLMKHLNRHLDTFKFAANGELIKDGAAIPGSTLLDLVNGVVRNRPKTGPKVAGFKEFLDLLHDTNVPQEAMLVTKRNMQPPIISPIVGTPRHTSTPLTHGSSAAASSDFDTPRSGNQNNSSLKHKTVYTRSKTPEYKGLFK